jgi:hypothetical protein
MPADVAASRSARAWAWALGENSLSPVTDQQTSAPPTRQQIQAEITAADDRQLNGGHENRADAAATILRWLIGDDDHVPIRCDNPGELVGGFGDIVRSRQQILTVMENAVESRQAAVSLACDIHTGAGHRQEGQQQADHCDGVLATLGWVLGARSAPISRTHRRPLTSKDLKVERRHGEDLAQQAKHLWSRDQSPSSNFGKGVSQATAWLVGDPAGFPAVGRGTNKPAADRPSTG